MTFNSSAVKISFILLLFSSAAYAEIAGELQCSIKNVLQLSDSGSFVTHGWSANYLNREFTVDLETGRVLRTTALKQRLSNFDKDHAPILLKSDTQNNVLKAVTLYGEDGQYALLEIRNTADGNPAPFFYHTDVGMVLTGICTGDS